MDSQDKLFVRLMIGFTDILNRYYRFNELFVIKLKEQMKNETTKDFFNVYIKNSNLNKNQKNDTQSFNLIPNKNGLVIAEANIDFFTKMISNFSLENIIKFFDNPELKATLDNGSDYLFGMQYLVVNIDCFMDLFKKLLKNEKIYRHQILACDDLKDEFLTYDEISKVRNLVAHQNSLVDDTFRNHFNISKNEADITFCLAGFLKIEKYIHDCVVIVLYVYKHFLKMDDVLELYEKLLLSKKIKLSQKERDKISKEK